MPLTKFAAYNKLLGPKSLLFFPDFGHESLAGAEDAGFAFLQERFRSIG